MILSAARERNSQCDDNCLSHLQTPCFITCYMFQEMFINICTFKQLDAMKNQFPFCSCFISCVTKLVDPHTCRVKFEIWKKKFTPNTSWSALTQTINAFKKSDDKSLTFNFQFYRYIKMTIQVPSSHTNTYVFLQFYFWKTLHVSADVMLCDCYLNSTVYWLLSPVFSTCGCVHLMMAYISRNM
jgi:hypothetical protein